MAKYLWLPVLIIQYIFFIMWMKNMMNGKIFSTLAIFQAAGVIVSALITFILYRNRNQRL